MAVKCDNCGDNALYTNSDPGVNPVNYCNICLPSWLQQRAEAGQFPLVGKVAESSKKEDKKEDTKEDK